MVDLGTKKTKSGADYTKWVEKAEAMHRDLMKEAGFLAK